MLTANECNQSLTSDVLPMSLDPRGVAILRGYGEELTNIITEAIFFLTKSSSNSCSDFTFLIQK